MRGSKVLVIAGMLLLAACGSGTGEAARGPLDEAAELRPDLVRVEPTVAAPGDRVELTFPEETMRGTPWVLEEDLDGSWEQRYLLHSDANGGSPGWQGADDIESWAWEDVGVSGPGPDVVEIPDLAAPGQYRVCTANALENFCVALEITE